MYSLTLPCAWARHRSVWRAAIGMILFGLSACEGGGEKPDGGGGADSGAGGHVITGTGGSGEPNANGGAESAHSGGAAPGTGSSGGRSSGGEGGDPEGSSGGESTSDGGRNPGSGGEGDGGAPAAGGSNGTGGSGVLLPERPSPDVPSAIDTAFDESTCPSAKIWHGDAIVQLESDITDLAGYECIFGDLLVDGAPLLLDFSGLESLRYVQGDFKVSDPKALNSFVGLEALTQIGGDLRIDSADVLVSATGLNNLTHIHGDLFVINSPVFQTLNGLEKLLAVGGDIVLASDSNLSLFGDGLAQLKDLGGAFVIDNCGQLGTVNGLANLARAGGGLKIVKSRGLSNIALPALKYVGGDVEFDVIPYAKVTLPLLTWIAGNLDLSFVTTPYPAMPAEVGEFNAPELVVVEGDVLVHDGTSIPAVSLPSLKFIDKSLMIGSSSSYLPGLTAFSASALAAVAGDVRFTRLSNLTSVDLGGLVQVQGTVHFEDLPYLSQIPFDALVEATAGIELKVLRRLASASFGSLLTAESIWLEYIGSEGETFSSFELGSLAKLDGEFYGSRLYGDPTFEAPTLKKVNSLTFEDSFFPELKGLSGLNEIEADFVIQRNEALLKVSGPAALRKIGGNLWFLENPRVTRAPGLSALTDVVEYVYVKDNPELLNFSAALESAGDIWFERNTALTSLMFPNLLQSGIEITLNTALECVSMPQLTTLGVVGGSFRLNNTHVPQCHVDQIFSQIAADNPAYVSKSSNGDGTCPVPGCP